MNLLLPPDCSPDSRLLLGISGGRDSVALLELLLAQGYRNLILCHLNHRLRGGDSEADAEFVAELAGEHRLHAEIEAEDVAERSGRERVSIEVAARRARIAFFKRCAERQGTNRVLLAHHADDQVETILIHLLRGTGMKGLAGMRPVARLGGLILIRPLLRMRREDLPVPSRFREDASNSSDAFLRNRLRNRAIPVLREALGRDFTPNLCRMAEVLRGEEQLLERLTNDALLSMRDRKAGLPLTTLRELPLALQRRVLFQWLTESGVPGAGFRQVEAARALYTDPDGPAKANLPAGWHVRRRSGRLFLQSPA